jgi:hypothetical protein
MKVENTKETKTHYVSVLVVAKKHTCNIAGHLRNFKPGEVLEQKVSTSGYYDLHAQDFIWGKFPYEDAVPREKLTTEFYVRTTTTSVKWKKAKVPAS